MTTTLEEHTPEQRWRLSLASTATLSRMGISDILGHTPQEIVSRTEAILMFAQAKYMLLQAYETMGALGLKPEQIAQLNDATPSAEDLGALVTAVQYSRLTP